MKRLSVLLISFCLLISLTNCSTCSTSNKDNRDYGHTQKKYQNETRKSFDVEPGGLLEVNIETGGGIEVVGWNKNVVDVEVTLGGRNSDNVDVTIRKNSNGVSVETEFIEKDWDNNLKCNTVIKVPYNYNIDFSTMGGGVYFKNIKGEFSGKTMGGSMEMIELQGNADMTTMGGSISISDSDLDGSVKTMGGSIDLSNVTGNVNTKTMGGSINHDVKKRKDGKGSTSRVNIETMGGSINVTEAPYGAKVKTMGGSIHIDKAEKFVDAVTMGGHIMIDDVDGWVKTKTMGGDIKCTVTGSNAGDKDVRLTSMSGDIELFVPKDFSADIDIEIRYDRRDEGDFEIVSDFDIDTQVKRKSKNRLLLGSGTAGDGKHKITIKTVNGSVYLKKK